MNRKIITGFAVLGVLMYSCGDHDCEKEKSCDHDKKEKTEVVADEAVEEKNHEGNSHAVESVLELNDGAKWIANEATHVGMAAMQDILKINADEKNYTDLAEKLSEQTTNIINQCDMTGPDHDMLHKVLHPILETIDVIKTAEDMQIGDNNVTKLDALLTDYFEYFTTK